MMRHKKICKRISLLICFSLLCGLLLACSGCDMLQSKAAEDFETSIDITDIFNEELERALKDNEDLFDYVEIDSFSIDVTVSAKDDGYKLTVDERALSKTIENLLDSLKDGQEKYLKENAPAGEADLLVGSWVCSMDLTDMLYDSMESELGSDIDYFSFHNFGLLINLSFGSDGTIRMTIDDDALEQAMNTLIQDVEDGLENYLLSYIKDMGLDMTVEEVLESEGYTWDEFLNEVLYGAGFDIEDFLESAAESNFSGAYTAENGTLTVTSSAGSNILTYTLSGRTLTLVSPTGSDFFGDTLVFTKK